LREREKEKKKKHKYAKCIKKNQNYWCEKLDKDFTGVVVLVPVKSGGDAIVSGGVQDSPNVHGYQIAAAADKWWCR
jgi:hypothetical protein